MAKVNSYECLRIPGKYDLTNVLIYAVRIYVFRNLFGSNTRNFATNFQNTWINKKPYQQVCIVYKWQNNSRQVPALIFSEKDNALIFKVIESRNCIPVHQATYRVLADMLIKIRSFAEKPVEDGIGISVKSRYGLLLPVKLGCQGRI